MPNLDFGNSYSTSSYQAPQALAAYPGLYAQAGSGYAALGNRLQGGYGALDAQLFGGGGAAPAGAGLGLNPYAQLSGQLKAGGINFQPPPQAGGGGGGAYGALQSSLGGGYGALGSSLQGGYGGLQSTVVAGLQGMYGQDMGDIQKFGQTQYQQILNGYAQALAQQQQGLAARGLDNSTIGASVATGLTQNEQLNLTSLAEQQALAAIGVRQQDQGAIAAMQAQLGQAGLASQQQVGEQGLASQQQVGLQGLSARQQLGEQGLGAQQQTGLAGLGAQTGLASQYLALLGQTGTHTQAQSQNQLGLQGTSFAVPDPQMSQFRRSSPQALANGVKDAPPLLSQIYGAYQQAAGQPFAGSAYGQGYGRANSPWGY